MSWTVIGQDQPTRALSEAVRSGRVAHAYLFDGPAGVGKSLAALQFAQLLNCDAPDAPCGACRSCQRIQHASHPDVEVVSIGGLCAERDHDHSRDNSRDIRICQVRRIQEVASRAPFEGRHRVFIIDPAEALNGARTNPDVTAPAVAALLKTLEEPPPNVVFVLVADQAQLLPDTIRSRARRVPFSGQPRAEIERALRNRWDAEPQEAADLARLAGGRLGWAVAALQDEALVERRAHALDEAEHIARATLTDRFALAASIGAGYARDRAATHQRLDAWLDWWRDIMLVAAGREAQAADHDRLDTLRQLASACSVPGAVGALKAIGEAKQQLRDNGSPTLVLEALMLALPVLQPNAVTTRLRR